jgi:hypothetical protein
LSEQAKAAYHVGFWPGRAAAEQFGSRAKKGLKTSEAMTEVRSSG